MQTHFKTTLVDSAMAGIDLSTQPVSKVTWVHRDDLIANEYNPNFVAPPELDLLEISILEDGWTQPIVTRYEIQTDGRRGVNQIIVDGFHRYIVSGRPKVYALTRGFVPTTHIVPADFASQQMSTIRHNRAKGTHAVLQMAEIVAGLIRGGMAMEEIMFRLQMEREEVVRLALQKGVPQTDIVVNSDWSSSWKPK